MALTSPHDKGEKHGPATLNQGLFLADAECAAGSAVVSGMSGVQSSDWAPFLRVSKDGHIWWRLEDAYKLGAGYVPTGGDGRNRPAKLVAPNNQVRADERTLIGAFNDPRLVIARPRILERDDGRFVDAGDFLGWLSRYVTESKGAISFPQGIASALRGTAGASAECPKGSPEFKSLTAALEGWLNKPLHNLPDEIRQRIESEFSPMPWDSLSEDQRRSVALQLDYQHDPATEQDRQFWWDFFERQRALETQIVEWEAAAAPTAGDLTQKEKRLAELRQELARMDQQQRQARGDYYPERKPPDRAGSGSPGDQTSERYIAYPKALKLLAERLSAIPEEMAAWVMEGPKDGGLAAYLNANELDPPPRFYYHYSYGGTDDFDYLSPLMACWFRKEDIAHFEPGEHYITGKTLIERWSKYPGIQPEAYIRAKIRESRLLDAHPIFGLTQGTNPEVSSCPPLASALFALSDVKDIEAEDFSTETEPKPKRNLDHDLVMQQRANEIAANKMKETKRPVTRNKVAQLLAAELGMKTETVLRRIRKQW